MKHLLLFLGIVPLLFLGVGCENKPPPPVCADDCLFTLQDASGTMVRMECFNRYGIKTKHPETDSTIYGIPDQLDSSFAQAGRSVIFTGTFRENALTPSFPDPGLSPTVIFQVKVEAIQ